MPAMVKVNPGDRYGLWTVLEVIRRKMRNTECRCRCECGVERTVLLCNLRQGKSTNCGHVRDAATAKRNETHGQAHTRLYRIWAAMLTRCTNPNFVKYCDYGGRGIRVFWVWHEFAGFCAWAMRSGYRDGLTIERKDVNGNYDPDNCCWIPAKRQARNRRDTKMLTAFGETKAMADWADDSRCKVGAGTLKSRIYRDGWPAEEAIATPKTHKNLRNRNTVA